MKDSKTLLLLGPGESSRRFKVDDLQKVTTVSFSGNIDWLAENNVYADYWTFFDPHSTLLIFDKISNGTFKKDWAEGLKSNTKLLYNKFIGTDVFYEKGYTTPKGPQWNRDVFGKQLLPELSENIFAGAEVVDQEVNIDNYGSYYQDSNKAPLVVHCTFDPQGRKLNTDKFVSVILPNIIACFKDVEQIYSIGFGDFDAPRINTGQSLGYESYLISYNILKYQMRSILQERNIKIDFINKDSHYKDLQWEK